MKTLTCPICGKTFEKRTTNQIYCSKRCSRWHSKKAAKEYRLSHYDDAISSTKPVTFNALAKAKKKPANTSPVRWRIELRRRAMQRQFGRKSYLDILPNPDLLY